MVSKVFGWFLDVLSGKWKLFLVLFQKLGIY